MYKILPAILEYSNSAIQEKLSIALKFADTIHVDMVDKSFSERTTSHTPEVFESYTTRATFELHMMVENPTAYVQAYANAGFKRFIGHVEYMQQTTEFIADVKSLQKEAFLGIDYDTPVEMFQSEMLTSQGLDGFTVMAIHAGASGQKFIENSTEKVASLRAKFPQLPIEVDGGINDKTLLLAKEKGATMFCVNSFLFGSPNQEQTYRMLTNLL